MSPSGEGVVSRDGHVEYVSELLASAGASGDPLEEMLIGQTILANHMLGRLYSEASRATKAEVAKLRLDAAARLLGELRRCVLAVAEYRARSAHKGAPSGGPGAVQANAV
jgi:hypothetical protein